MTLYEYLQLQSTLQQTAAVSQMSTTVAAPKEHIESCQISTGLPPTLSYRLC